MANPQNLGLGELGQRVQAMSDPAPGPHLHPYQGVPLPIDPSLGNRVIPPYEPIEDLRVAPPQPAPTYTSAGPIQMESATTAVATNMVSMNQNVPKAPKSGLQRALDAVRSTVPLVQKLLPLLDGNFATAISTLVVPQLGHHPTAHPQQPPVNLQPIEQGLAELQADHRDLRGQVQEQVTSLKRVEDQLDRVREATDRNTLEQQELLEDLRTVGGRVRTFAIIGLILLLLSLAVNAFLLFQLQHILH